MILNGFKFIGDPHLGKKFNNGVPLHRKGEREAEQMKKFQEELLDLFDSEGNKVEAVIIVGDLFDQFHVSNEVIAKTFEILDQVAITNDDVTFLILRGNHDVTRNTALRSSFDLLSLMCRNLVNVHPIPIKTIWTFEGNKHILLCPYDEFVSTKEAFSGIGNGMYDSFQFEFVVGHWDTIAFTNDHNLMPVEQMSKVTKLIINGHEHTPMDYNVGDVRIIKTGSMLPYSHGEDPNEEYYVTRTLEQVLETPDAFKDKCLRITLKKGQELPAEIDARQITIKYVTEEETDETEVVMEEFSIKTLYDEVMKENEVSDELAKEYWEKFNAASA